MANIRIKDQTTDTALSAGDYVIVDSASEGTRKFDLGGELADIRQSIIDGGGGSGISSTEKSLILTLLSKAAYADDDAGETYEALAELWTVYSVTWSGSGYTHSNTSVAVEGGNTYTSTITATGGHTISTVVVTMGGNTVQGAWNNGTVTIPNVTGNIVITVTTVQATVSSISALYTQSGTVYDTDTLDSLKSDLVVTATYVDQSTSVVPSAEYTLSGTLTVGTSTITVSYGGKTTTFTVTVTSGTISVPVTWSGTGTDNTSTIIDATEGEVHLTVPFVSGDQYLADTANVSDFAYKNWTKVYSDAECTQQVGFYYFDTDAIETTGRTTANSPAVYFDTDVKIAPSGYYCKIVLSKSGSTQFSSNANARNYLNNHVTSVTVRNTGGA